MRINEFLFRSETIQSGSKSPSLTYLIDYELKRLSVWLVVLTTSAFLILANGKLSMQLTGVYIVENKRETTKM